jgi:hypothetical protein
MANDASHNFHFLEYTFLIQNDLNGTKQGYQGRAGRLQRLHGLICRTSDTPVKRYRIGVGADCSASSS